MKIICHLPLPALRAGANMAKGKKTLLDKSMLDQARSFFLKIKRPATDIITIAAREYSGYV